MFDAKLLNSDASLNDFIYVTSLDYVPGENLDVVIQLHHAVKNIRHTPSSAATLILTFVDSDGVEFDVSASVLDSNDRSLWKVSLSQAQTETLAGQNIEGTIDYNGDASKIYRFVLQNVLIRNNLAGDC